MYLKLFSIKVLAVEIWNSVFVNKQKGQIKKNHSGSIASFELSAYSDIFLQFTKYQAHVNPILFNSHNYFVQSLYSTVI